MLGPPQVIVNSHKMVGLRGDKSLALLAFLAVEARAPHQRSELAMLLWPEHPRFQALQNLRQTLCRLRKAIEDGEAAPAHLLVDTDTLQFNCRSDFWLDTAAFEALIAGVERCSHRRLDQCPPCMANLAMASRYYRGEFAAALHPTGSQALDEWLLFQRESLEQRACDVLCALASSHLALCQLETAQKYAHALLQIDQWHEAGQRLWLHVLALRQGRQAALRSYNTFRRALSDELGLEPENATLDLMNRIRAGNLPTM